MKMSTATDIKYVYVNYIVAPNSGNDITAAMLEANKTDMLASDATSFGQFIEILNPQAIEEASQPMIIQQENQQTPVDNHQFVNTSDLTIISTDYIPTEDGTMEFITPANPTVVQVPRDLQTSDDNLDVLCQDIVSIAEVSRSGEDHLQRLTNELLFDNNNDEGELDTSCGSFMEYSEEEPEDDDSEQDLTNLAWLSDPNQSIAVNVLAAVVDEAIEQVVEEPMEKIEKVTKPVKTTPIESEEEIKDPAQALIRDKNLTQERFNKFMLQVQECQLSYIQSEIDYRENSIEKPPYIYAQMIAMAMVERGRMTLKDIEQWIQERFAYYRCNGNWNNSIRHNLSIHFGFTKIARDKNEKGKGGYWELSMNITKGEKKRVRNRSKRGLANGTKGGAGGVKRARRTANGEGRAKVRKEGKLSVPSKVEESLKEEDEVQIATEVLMKVLPPNNESGTQMSDGYETACSDATTSNGYEQDVYASTLLHEGANEIFLGCDIPLSGDCIIIPYTGHPLTLPMCTSSSSPNSTTTTILDSTPTSPTNYDHSIGLNSQLTATLIAHGLSNPTFGPNVIVETLPYGDSLSQHQTMLDQAVDIERQFSSMVTMPEPELMAEYDAYFDYSW